MSEKGMIVYGRGTDRRGIIMSTNFSTNQISVQWDDGKKELVPLSTLMSEELYYSERHAKMSIREDQCAIGNIVYRSGKTAPLSRGKIAGPVANKLVIIEWDGGSLSKVDIKQLLSETDGIKENQRLLDEAERLEREFAEVEQQCETKLAEAAKLIREANTLASSKRKNLQDMYEAVRPLEMAMDEAGWSTSSWHC